MRIKGLDERKSYRIVVKELRNTAESASQT